MAKRCMQWADVGGKRRLLVGGKINKFIPNPTFDPIARPGSLEDYFRGRNDEGLDVKTMFGDLEPLDHHPGYRDRDARLALLDEQGLDGGRCSPPSASACRKRCAATPALHAALTALQHLARRGLGLRRRRRAPLRGADDHPRRPGGGGRSGPGARPRCPHPGYRPGPVPDGGDGYVSPGDPQFDPVWALVAEAGVPMALHAGLSGVGHYGRFWKTGAEGGAWGFNRLQAGGRSRWWRSRTAASPTRSPP